MCTCVCVSVCVHLCVFVCDVNKNLPFDHSMMSRLLSVSILVSWYKNSGTVLVVGTDGTNKPVDPDR